MAEVEADARTRPVGRAVRKVRTYLNSYVQFKWVVGVYFFIALLIGAAFITLQRQTEDRVQSRRDNIVYLDYLEDVRGYDRCVADVERTNAERTVLEILGAEEDDQFRDILDAEFPIRSVEDTCGTAPLAPIVTPDESLLSELTE